MKRILAIVPSTGYLNPICVKSWYSMYIPDEYVLVVDYITGYGIELARNQAAQQAIDENYDYLFFIDSDIILPTDTLTKLLSCDSDIITGWYMSSFMDNRISIAKFDTERLFYEAYKLHEQQENIINNIAEVDGCGFGCILIKTEVFKNMEYPFFKYVEYGNNQYLSEDLYCCGKMKDAGYKIKCDVTLKVGHVKQTIL